MLSLVYRNYNHKAKFINSSVPVLCLSNPNRSFYVFQEEGVLSGCRSYKYSKIDYSTSLYLNQNASFHLKSQQYMKRRENQARFITILSGSCNYGQKKPTGSCQSNKSENDPKKLKESLIKKGVILLSFIIGSGVLYKVLEKDVSVKKVTEKDIRRRLGAVSCVVNTVPLITEDDITSKRIRYTTLPAGHDRNTSPSIKQTQQATEHGVPSDDVQFNSGHNMRQTNLKNPIKSDDIPNEVPYLLIGGGTASFSAFRAIKSLEPKAKVLVVSNEPHFPYMRPPLSKEMFYNEDRKSIDSLEFKQWNGTERSLFYEPEDFYTPCSKLSGTDNGGVSVARGWTVTKLDVINKIAMLDDGKEIKYDKCLIATGARPKSLPVFENGSTELKEKVSLYRCIEDFEELDYIIESGARSVAIIGGGFLGSELACALSRRGNEKNLKITQIFKEEGNMSKVLPKYLSDWTTMKVRNEGVTVLSKSAVEKVLVENNKVKLHINNGDIISVDHIIVAVGVEPNTHLAESSKLELDKDHGGYLVNAELEARKDLFIAGDCACFYDVKLGRRRVEHHDHAVVSGRLAGENMTGAGKPYWHQSMFWSDLGPDIGYEAIGIVDSSLPTVGVFAKDGADLERTNDITNPSNNIKDTEANSHRLTAPKFGEDYVKGVIFYLRDGIVVGIVLWNIFNKMAVARQVIKDEKKYEDLNEVAKLFSIHEQ